MTMRKGQRRLAWVLVTALLSSPLAAFAQSDEQRAAARELATSGLDAFKAGKYDQALENFTKAESLFHALPHLLFIARSHAKLGQYVSAREAYLKITREVLPANAPQAARDAQSNASSEIANVEPKIGRVTINVAGKEQLKNLVVTLDGTPVSAVLIGSPMPIDPGDHVIEGVATGMRGKANVGVAPGQRQEIALKLEPDASAAPPIAGVVPATVAAQPGAAGPPAAGQPAPPPDTNANHGGANGLRIGSYVAFGVGAVGIVGGIAFMLQSSSKRSDADKLCTLPNGYCELSVKDQVNSLDSDANKARTLAIVGYALGAAGIGAGVTLFVLSAGHSGKSASIAPWVGVNSAGVRGKF
jgi:tetratricopeptide (TPR) repeat protein